MSKAKVLLERVCIKNYLSLRDVELPFKPLTVLVGPNASGKSNILSALGSLMERMTSEDPPSVEFVQDSLWAGGGSHITFQLQAQARETRCVYDLALKAHAENPLVDEKLLVNDVKTIAIEQGEGAVWDEDGKNRTRYKSNQLALRSAGDYGDKPATGALTEFIKGWKFYDIQPDFIRDRLTRFSPAIKGLRESPKLDRYGFRLSALLTYWHEYTPEGFLNVSESLADTTNLKIDQRTIGEYDQLCLLEGYKEPIPLNRASDGTLRLVAYYTLLNEPELPPLIAIEEPERNLHPGALTDIANVLGKLSERTQVIITTHSSQLLDAFNPENLSGSLGVLLLRNRHGSGTEVINIEDIRADRAALDGWITDFGIGSAIFDSQLLQDLMED